MRVSSGGVCKTDIEGAVAKFQSSCVLSRVGDTLWSSRKYQRVTRDTFCGSPYLPRYTPPPTPFSLPTRKISTPRGLHQQQSKPAQKAREECELVQEFHHHKTQSHITHLRLRHSILQQAIQIIVSDYSHDARNRKLK